ncbi:3'(2'),5'-bisphosphate nucleotidase CysQ [Gallaecimonas sp. GXIMD4217]|uniref:3'(2'),5'-bisphosphate nucleotidase CysQ n=1 Tax=Gallaecimonas sp. GXIMD4217 TaxID=3131927 RepID=UPI00311B173E
MNPEALLDAIITLAKEAGDAILPWYGSEALETHTKADDSPVTNADLAANEVLMAGLRRLTPQIPILSEEACDVPFEVRRRWASYWLLDPLDGTREFVNGSPDFAVNIALVVDNEPVLGVIHAPVRERTYWAVKGQGAYRDGQAIQCRPCGQPPVIAVSRAQLLDPHKARLRADLEFATLPYGSASLKSCLVAEGRADAYIRIGPTGEWDTAASWAIVREAGGVLVDLDLKPLTFNRSEDLGNPNYAVLGGTGPIWKGLFADQA